MKTLLITRPLQDALPLAKTLEQRGFATFCEPLLEIQYLPDAGQKISAALARRPQAVLATSRRSVEAMPASAHALPLFAVGTESARYARDLGFSSRIESGEAASALAALVRGACDPTAGPLLYVRGRDTHVDMAAELHDAGFKVDSVIAYHAKAATELSGMARMALEDGQIHAALFFSARTAATYASLVKQTGLARSHATIRALCLSEAVAAPLRFLPWHSVLVAERADLAHMLEATRQFS